MRFARDPASQHLRRYSGRIASGIVPNVVDDANGSHRADHLARHASPEGFWYDQDEDEWVLVLEGAARLRFEGQEAIELQPGSFVHIPAHQRHRVDWTDPTEPTIWLAVFYKDR